MTCLALAAVLLLLLLIVGMQHVSAADLHIAQAHHQSRLVDAAGAAFCAANILSCSRMSSDDTSVHLHICTSPLGKTLFELGTDAGHAVGTYLTQVTMSHMTVSTTRTMP